MNRQEAILTGSSTYVSDRPCNRGHTSPRNTRSSNCLECWREDGKAKRDSNPLGFKAAKRAEYQRNKLAIQIQQAKYRQDNWETIYEKRIADPGYREYMNAYFRKYYKTDVNRAKHLARVRHRQLTIKQRTPLWADTDTERALIQALYVEAATKTTSTGIQHVVDHIVPLAGKSVSGLHCAANLRVITWRENSAKWYHFDESLISP